jgi:tRNA (adenine57-N1/adenine58-N1)-methyltransferase
MHNPWEFLEQAHRALQGGGFLGALVPTINQVAVLVDALHSEQWFMVEVEELLLRQYKTSPGRIRPEDQMVAHTGYLIFARKLAGGVALAGDATLEEGDEGALPD